MPHTVALIRQDAYETILGYYSGVVPSFLYNIESVVADAFNDLAGETLEARVSSKAHQPIVSSSCPADLVLTVMAWWSETRARNGAAIKAAIKARIWSWYPVGVKIEVFINLVGSPSSDPSLLDLPVSVLLAGEKFSSNRAIDGLRRARVERVEQLVAKSRSDLLQITNLGKTSVDFIQQRLEEKGLSLRPE